MSFLGTVTGLVLLLFVATAIDNPSRLPEGILAERSSEESVRKWYFIGGSVPGIVEKSPEDICKEPSTMPDLILLPKQPELSRSASDVSVDWTHSWPCGASVYNIQWDDHRGNVNYETIDGNTTRFTLANISGCVILDVCVNALFADGVDGKVYIQRPEEAYCGQLQDRYVAQDAEILVAEDNSNVHDPKAEKVLRMAQTLTCPILYYVLTFGDQESKSELALPREQCKMIPQMDADEYAVRVTLVTSKSQMRSSPEIKLEGSSQKSD
ncbi:hypothetical protein T265_01861 [Opisthorchis viverrini]|uniref:Uncharacterized protein n=1 Tax=Opisthorchis viverrini TaxID=6198 RepID=A0A075AIN1_OPIVI|nr:hypothetical protein T265_01861 [Opisthorchis viverrini]KER31924.1 hypothetical protein T265_01861 [Opisthorchis viverrini]